MVPSGYSIEADLIDVLVGKQDRAYIIGQDGHFLGAEILSECTDDETAEKAAQKLVGGHSVELWDRDRLVIRLFSKKK